MAIRAPDGANKEKMRKCTEWISLHFLILSLFPLHFLILSPFPLHSRILSPFSRSPAARLQQPCYHPSSFLARPSETLEILMGFRSIRTMNCAKAAAIFSVVSFGFWNVLSESFMSLPRLCPKIYMQKKFLHSKLKRSSLMSNNQNVCSNIWN